MAFPDQRGYLIPPVSSSSSPEYIPSGLHLEKPPNRHINQTSKPLQSTPFGAEDQLSSELPLDDGAPHSVSEAESYEGSSFQLLLSGILLFWS